jgi:Tol biopolymer transport system component
VLDDVRMDPKNTGLVYFDVSPSGAAVYVPGFPRPRDRDLIYMDQRGQASPVVGGRRSYFGPVVSPDGKQIAVTIEGLENTLWVLEVQSGTLNRLTFDMDVVGAAWSANGRSLYLTANADGPRSIYRVAADGSGKPELVFSRNEWWINDAYPHPDGSGVIMAAQDIRGHDLFFVRKGSGKPEPFLVTPAEERAPTFSPDGGFVAYMSNESNRPEVYVRPFPGPGAKRQVSSNGGRFPRFSADGREILYWEADRVGRLMRVPFEAGVEAKLGKPQPLFEVPLRMMDDFAVTPDSGRFVMVKPEDEEESPLLIVVIPGFLDELKARLAGKRP